MPRILLTAFEPYDCWSENSSWLTLMELTRWFDSGGQVVTRRYPVNLSEMMNRLGEDLLLGFDFAIHLGQSPGSPTIKLESTGLNVTNEGLPIIPTAPAAFRTTLPLEEWSRRLCDGGIPTVVSHHAGTYLCNAALFFSQHYAASHGMATKACFVHLPLAPHQAAARPPQQSPMPSMSLPMMAAGLAILLKDLIADESPTANIA